MFDIAWSELALIGAVALIVIGPKDLPKVMRVMGQWTRKARLLASEFQHNFDELVRQADLDDVRRQVQAVNPQALKQKVQSEMESLIDPKAIEEALKVAPDQGKPAGPAHEPAAAAAVAETAPAALAEALVAAPPAEPAAVAVAPLPAEKQEDHKL